MKLKRIAFLGTTIFLLTCILTASAGLSFIGGANITNGSIKGEVTIAGLGNTATSVTMTVTGSGLTAWCQNNGGKQAPGQNPVTVNSTVAQSVFNTSNGNDTVNFHVEIKPTPEVAGCPNGNWSVVDLTGTVNITFVATNANDTATLSVVCHVNERNASITC